MDAPKPDLKKGDSLPLEDSVIRIVMIEDRDRQNKNIPAHRCFTLSDTDKKKDFGLSVDYENKTTPEEVLIRVGLSRKTDRKTGREVYKNYSLREIYKLNIGFLRGFNEISNVIYEPTLTNLAHSLILFKKENYDQIQPEIFQKIRDNALKIDVDMAKIKEEVESQRI